MADETVEGGRTGRGLYGVVVGRVSFRECSGDELRDVLEASGLRRVPVSRPMETRRVALLTVPGSWLHDGCWLVTRERARTQTRTGVR
jgi:hypothetical protein